MRRFCLLAAVLGLALAAPCTVRAQAPDEPVALDDDLAAKHSADGRAAVTRGDWPAAYASYRAAYAIREDVEILGALGDAAYHAGKYRDAAEHLSLYLQKAPASLSAAARAAAEKTLAQARLEVGGLAITAPAGAEVFVNHLIAGTAPLAREVFVVPGKAEIEARSAGGEVARQTATVDRGKSATVTLVFGAAPAPTGTVVATAAVAPSSSAAPNDGPRREILIAGASIAAGAAVVGAILIGVSRVKASDEEGLRNQLSSLGKGNVCLAAARDPRCDQIKDAAGAADAMLNTGAWLIIGAGAAGIATFVYSMVAGNQATAPAPAPRVEAAAVITPKAGGFTLSARW